MPPKPKVDKEPVRPTITTLPRCDILNEDRSRWAEEYDKAEVELLKPYIPNTYVLSLRRADSPMGFFPSIAAEERKNFGGTLSGTNTSSPAQVLSTPLNKSSPPPSRTPLPSLNHTLTTSPLIKSAPNAKKLNPLRSPGAQRPNSTSPTKSPLRAHTSLSATITSISPQRKTYGPISASEIAALCSLVNPSDDFKGKIALDLLHVDLTWVMRAAQTAAFEENKAVLTIETLKEDAYVSMGAKARKCVLLNSPRSVLALMRNGVTVPDLLVTPSHVHAQNFNLQSKAQEAQLQQLTEALEQRRQQLVKEMKETYRTICGTITLREVLRTIHERLTESHDAAEGATMLKLQKERQEATLRANRIKLERQSLAHQEAERKLLLSEQKRLEIEQERQNALQQQKLEAKRRAAELEQKMEELRQQTQAIAEEQARKAMQRRIELDERDKVMKENIQRMREEKRTHSVEHRMHKEAKIKAARERLESTITEKAQAFETKAELAQRRKEELEAKKLQQFEHKIEKQERVRQQRELASERTIQMEHEMLKRAEERRQLVEQRLEAFLKHREAIRAERAEMELKKAQERHQVLEKSEVMIESKKSQMLEHIQQVEENQRRLREEKEHQIEEAAFRLHVTQTAKKLHVQRQHKADEFKKLILIDTLERRKAKIDATVDQKIKLQKQVCYARDQMRAESAMGLSKM